MNSSPLRPFHYAAFGLRIASAVPLPELETAGDESNSEVSPDVVVRTGALAGPAGERVWEIDGERFALRVERVGRFEVRGGREVTVHPDPAASPAEVRAYLLGTVFGAMFQQRGLLALHASAVALGADEAIAFVGESGAGKSTLAMALNARGHKLLCDDVCVTDPEAEDGAIAWPGVRRLKLWSQSIALGGGSTEGLEPVLQREDKYHVPSQLVAPYRPYRLRAVVVLGPRDGGGAPGLARLRGAAAVQPLVSHTFRGLMVPYMAAAERHFRACLALAGRCPVLRLDRPGGLEGIEATCDAIEQHFAGKVEDGDAGPEHRET